MISLPKKIITSKVVLKPVSTNQLDEFYDAFEESFTNLTKYYIPAWSRFAEIPTKEDMLQFLLRTQKEWEENTGFLFSVYDKKTNIFLGQGEIHHYDPSVPKARLGYWIRDGKTGFNYATEVAAALTDFGFNILKCERLEIRNDVRNPASGSIAKKLGYTFLTVFEKNKQGKTGDFWDLEIYSQLKTKSSKDSTIEFIYDES